MPDAPSFERVQSDGTIILAVVARDVYAAVHVARLTAGGAAPRRAGPPC